MPSFETPTPITVSAHVEAGSIRLSAGDRTDTVVEVLPRNPKKDNDRRAVEQTEVTFVNGTLTVKTAKHRNSLRKPGTVDVTVELPTGSVVDVTGAWAQVLGEGRLGEVRVKTSTGDTRLDTTGPLRLTASHGSITVGRVEGTAEVSTSTGSVRIGSVTGSAVLKNSHGTTTVELAGGDLRVSGANGDIDVRRAEASVAATTAHGTIRVGEVARGTAQLETNYGAIEVGIRSGTAAWLDVNSGAGQVRNMLTGTEAPDEAEETVKVRARTRYGNIDVLRARG
ncbi:DUF4097 family beta strand repeat-containing protein [Kitasatospora sp. NPDC096147]|uniref:DUF4097 family beta strand repeat-containing protein n=1 Tax=Kitasatospora sp. NPDC096147 TaxID=3364093 RepID=UPI00381B0CF4